MAFVLLCLCWGHGQGDKPHTQAGPRPTRPQALVAKANGHAPFMVACNARLGYGCFGKAASVA